jgi:hypothetical protein
MNEYGPYGNHKAVIIASKNPNVTKGCTADKRKHVATMIPQKAEIIRRLKSSRS